jgi:pimeloyl-ACP methyl ester carboxylesterase
MRRLTLLAGSLVLAATLTGSARQNRPAEPPPGRLVDIGGRSVHVRCTGPTGAGPTAILAAGDGDYSNRWIAVQELLAPRVRSCAFDRAASGWSDPGPAPPTLRQQAFDLHAALGAMPLPGPYVLVGHSVGGLLVRVYAERYGTGVVGFVLVDPTHENTRLGRAVAGSSEVRLVRIRDEATDRPIPEPRLMGPSLSGPPAPGSLYLAEEFQQLYASRQNNPVPLEDRPLIVLAGTRPQDVPRGIAPDTWAALEREKSDEKADRARLSRNARLVRDPSSGHNIHVENPRIVAGAIEDVVTAAANGTRLN